MAKYRCVFETGPATRIRAPIHVNVSESGLASLIRVIPVIRREGQEEFQAGLRLLVDVEAISLKEALRRAHMFVGMTLSSISFVSGVGIPPWAPLWAIEVPQGKTTVEFEQSVNLGQWQASQGEAPIDLVSASLTAFASLDEDTGSRVNRALVELWRGQSDSISIDRFLHFWTGLEALNAVFQKELHPEEETPRCRRCGEQMRCLCCRELATVPSTVGIRAFMEKNVEDGRSMYIKARDLRVHLTHGRGRLDLDTEEVFELSIGIRHVLRLALCRYLGVAIGLLNEPPTIISNSRSALAFVSGTLSGPAEVLSRLGNESPLDIRIQSRETLLAGEGIPKWLLSLKYASRTPGIAVTLHKPVFQIEGVNRIELVTGFTPEVAEQSR